MNKSAIAFIFFLIICAFLIKSFSSNSPSVKQSNLPLCKDCNVLVVAFDALQATHVTHLGYKINTTPTIDAIAKEGVSFTNNISAASWTVPSYMSIFTGLFPTEHKVVNKFVTFTKTEQIITNLTKVSPNVKTLAQVFKDNGYITGGFTGDAGVSSTFGYNLGFDVYKDNETFGSMETAATQAAQWLKDNKGKKFFLFLHGYDMHGQFKLPPNYAGRFMPKDYTGPFKGTPKEQAQLREKGLVTNDIGLSDQDVRFWRSWYDSKIADADDRFNKFWQEFKSMGLDKNTLIILLSDHGTEFYEHKKFDHGHSLYDELVHVPLVFAGPNIPKGKKVDAQVSTIDIAPTILALTGITPEKDYASQIRGTSLLPNLMGKKTDPRDVYLETDYRNYTHKRGIRTGDGWKYIQTMETGAEELYNLNNDPKETNNLANQEGSMAEKLKNKVKEHLIDMGADPNGPWEIGCLPVYGDQCK